MLEIVLIASATLTIVLYGQARHAAFEIRRNRADKGPFRADPLLVLPPQDN